MHGSELARQLQQIDLENEAARQGLVGLSSGTARHAFITARMERMSRHIQQLAEQGKHEEIQAILLNDELWVEDEKRI